MRTAECVTPKHPDKMADQISDSILDVCLSTDPNSRVAVEVMGGHGKIYITGEVRSELGFRPVDVYEAVKKITGKDLEVSINVVEQSPEIANGVDTGGAGDQGIMTGYAIRETENFMPKEYELARSLARYIYAGHEFDGKTQVTLENDGSIATIVASFQNVPKQELHDLIVEWLETELGITESDGITIHCNPAGDWNIGGFDADTGLTGRKLAVDNYGPRYPIGGGAFSGKDATKVDRSAAYMARKIAVEFLEANPEYHEASVRLAYAIGVAEPVEKTMQVRVKDGEWKEVAIDEKYDLTPKGIIQHLNLSRPIYAETAKWGHFGNGFDWK